MTDSVLLLLHQKIHFCHVFTVKYRPGPQNIADALSRLTREMSNEGKNVAEEYIRYVAENAVPRGIPIQEIKEASAEDDEITMLRKCVQNNDWTVRQPAFKAVRNKLTVLENFASKCWNLHMKVIKGSL